MFNPNKFLIEICAKILQKNVAKIGEKVWKNLKKKKLCKKHTSMLVSREPI